MRILHILNELKPSGAEIMLELAAASWMRAGCELYMIALADRPGPQAEILKAAGWNVSNVHRTGGLLQLIGRLKSSIRAIQPDVVHLHQEGISLPICFAVWQTGTPIFRTVHNNFPFTGTLRLRKSLERWLCRRLGSRHLAISPSVQANELTRFHNPTDLCWNWFDTDRFFPPSEGDRAAARARLEIPRDSTVLLTVGNASDTKNYRVVVEALGGEKLSNVHYYQVGNPHALGTDEQLAHELGVVSRFHPMGPRKDVLDWLWACDVYLMPSIFEGYGLAAVEALAAGCHCVFSDCPGLSDFKTMDVHASWVEPTADSIQQAIVQVLENAAPSARINQNTRVIREAFGVENRSHAYLEMWSETLKTKR